MKLYDPFAGREVEARRDPVSKRVVITKADTPATGTRSLEARTPDGKYASTANSAQVLRVRVRHHPRSRLVEVHKALGPRLVDAAYRTQMAGRRAGESIRRQGSRAGSGYADMVGSMVGSLNRGGAAGKLGGAASMATTTPALGMGVSGYVAGRRRGKKKALAAAPMTKSLLRGDPFGQRAPGVSHNRWSKANSSIPDAARHGRRLPEEERLRT